MKKLFFEYDSGENNLPPIKPIKSYMPQWFKDLTVFNDKNLYFDKLGLAVKNAKNCMPFTDSLTSGYAIELWCDINIEIDNEGYPEVRWQGKPDPVAIRDPSVNDKMPVPHGYANSHFIWKIPYSMKIPKGYSCLFTHPLNRTDLPFITLSGIVDMDYAMPQGNLPFFIKNGFSGIIKSGTPITQIIPFKRERWAAQESNKLIQESKNNEMYALRQFFGWYKDNIWNKKIFE